MSMWITPDTNTQKKFEEHSHPDCVIDFFDNARAMQLVRASLSITSQTCALVGGTASNLIPGLSILTFPFLPYHSSGSVYNHFESMIEAFRVSAIADALFWGAQAIDSMGTLISDLVKPFAGHAHLLNLSSLSPFFNVVIPGFITAAGAVGAIVEVVELVKVQQALDEFHFRSNNKDWRKTLQYFQGPMAEARKTEGQHALDLLALQQKLFKKIHFSSDERFGALQVRIQNLLNKGEDVAEFNSILETIQSEMHRNVGTHTIYLLAALLGIVAGSLFLAQYYSLDQSQFQTLGYSLAMASTLLAMSNILIDQFLSQEDLLKIEKFFGTI